MATYNLHGFKNGLGLLNDLCEKSDIIAIQEHWLSKDKLSQLTTINDKLTGLEIVVWIKLTRLKFIGDGLLEV
jgi:hypothetical protein